MDFTAIMIFIKELAECIKEWREDKIVNRLLEPGKRVKRKVKLSIKRDTKGRWANRVERRRERDRMYHETMAQLAASSRGEITEFVVAAGQGKAAQKAMARKIASRMQAE